MTASESSLNQVNMSILHPETVYSNLLLTLVTTTFYQFLKDKLQITKIMNV